MKRLMIITMTAMLLVGCGSGVQYLEVRTYTPQRTIDSLTTSNGFILLPYDMWTDRAVLTASDSTTMTMVNNEVRFRRKTYTISVLELMNEKSIVRFRRK